MDKEFQTLQMLLKISTNQQKILEKLAAKLAVENGDEEVNPYTEVEPGLGPDTMAEEASSLGWPPGHWPESFHYYGTRYHLFSDEGERKLYRSESGRILIVYND